MNALKELEVDSDVGKNALEALGNRNTCANAIGDLLDGLNVEEFVEASQVVVVVVEVAYTVVEVAIGLLALF